MAIEKRTEIHSTRNVPSLNGLSNVVVAVSWSRIVSQTIGEGEEARVYTTGYPGVTELGAADPDNFIDFDNVTDDHLKAWIDQVFDVSAIDEQLEQQLQNIVAAPVSVSRPRVQ